METHGGKYEAAARTVRNWLTGTSGVDLIGAARILVGYGDLQERHYERQLEAGFSEDDIQDHSTLKLLQVLFE